MTSKALRPEHRMHRLFRRGVFIPAAVLAAAAAVAVPQAAHASSGGGCSGWATIPNSTIELQSCIYENSSHVVVSVLNYGSGVGYPLLCDNDLKMRDDTSGWHGEQGTFGCSQQELDVTATARHRYHTYGYVLVTNDITGTQYNGTIPNSPELTAS